MADRPRSVHLEVRGLGKSFGATRALDDVSVEVAGRHRPRLRRRERGRQVHAGQDHRRRLPPGSGRPGPAGDGGRLPAPRGRRLMRGIAIVAQEVALVPRLTVAQNVFLGAEPRRAGFIDRRSLAERFDRLAAEAGFDLDGRAVVGQPVDRRATAGGDPAVARPRGRSHRPRRAHRQPVRTEIERLHEIVRSLRSSGRTVILVSHFLQRGPRPVRYGHRPARRSR